MRFVKVMIGGKEYYEKIGEHSADVDNNAEAEADFVFQ